MNLNLKWTESSAQKSPGLLLCFPEKGEMLTGLTLGLLFFSSQASAVVTPTEAFGLAEDAVLETISVTADGGIKKHILKKGDGAAAQKGQVSLRTRPHPAP